MTADLSTRPDHAARGAVPCTAGQAAHRLAPAVTLAERPYLTPHHRVRSTRPPPPGKPISIRARCPLPPPQAPSPAAAEFGDVQVLWMGPEECPDHQPGRTPTSTSRSPSTPGSVAGGPQSSTCLRNAPSSPCPAGMPGTCSPRLLRRPAPAGVPPPAHCITTLLGPDRDRPAGSWTPRPATFECWSGPPFAGYFATWIARRRRPSTPTLLSSTASAVTHQRFRPFQDRDRAVQLAHRRADEGRRNVRAGAGRHRDRDPVSTGCGSSCSARSARPGTATAVSARSSSGSSATPRTRSTRPPCRVRSRPSGTPGNWTSPAAGRSFLGR